MEHTRERCLVDADIAEQVEPAGAGIRDLDQQVPFQCVLQACVILVKIRSPQVAVKDLICQSHSGDKHRELIYRWRWKKGITERLSIIIPADHIVWRQLDSRREVNE